MLKRLFSNQKSIKTALILLIVLSSIIPLLILGVSSYYTLGSFAEEEMANNFQSSNSHKLEMFNSFVSRMESTLDDISGSEATKRYLQVRESDTDDPYVSLVGVVEKAESVIQQQGNEVNSISFIWNDGTLPILRYAKYDGIYSLSKLQSGPYSELLEEAQSNKWSFVDGKVFLHRSLYSPKTGENIGVVILTVNEDYIKSILKSTDSELSVLTNGVSLFYPEGNRLISEEEMELLDDIETSNGETREITIGGNQYLLEENDTGIRNVKVIHVASLENISRTKTRVLSSVLISFVAATFIAIGFSVIMFRNISEPIRKLEKGMLEFEEGNLKTKVEVDRSDEFGKLAGDFNLMISKIETLIKENEEEQKSKQQLEMSFLQAQITPHFLYNTLNVLKILARQNRNDEVVEMSTALISLLMLASKGSEKTTIEQELQYTKDYITLMKIRREEEITFIAECDEGALSSEILKFSIQPFVENSIIHKNSNNALNINIDIKEKRNSIVIRILDNAGGFDKKKLKEKINDKNRFSSIGVNNVSDRIKLYYGEKYGVTINSHYEEGTLVTIKLPKIKH